MISNKLVDSVIKLVTVCRKERVKIALMGGIAYSLYARPRATYDVDGIIYSGTLNIDKLLNSLKIAGFWYDINAPVKLIHGLPFITLLDKKYKIYIDLFIAQNEFQKNVLERAKYIKFYKKKINIISPEDLILIKLQTGRERDMIDTRELLSNNFQKIDIKYLKKWAKRLGISIFLKDELRSLGLEKKYG